MRTEAPGLLVASAIDVWSHPRVAGWAVWVRRQGFRGRLPRWAVRVCTARYPATTCRCRMYQVDWLAHDG